MKNAMANPRKFSEKIALIKQKEAEGDAAFQQIINEVSAVTKDPATSVPFRKHLPQLYATYKAGSLPDINQSAGIHQQNNPGSIDLKGAIDEFNLLNNGETSSPRPAPRRQNLHGYAPVAPRSARCRTVEPHVPYHPPYLSPPPLPGPEWRRFKSDSDLHERLKQQPSAAAQQQQQQAVAQQQQHSPVDAGVMGGGGNGSVMSPLMHRRVLEVGSGSLMPGDHMKAFAGRPKSCGEYPVALNNNLPYPSSDVLMNGSHHQQQQPVMVGAGGGGPGGGGSMGSIVGGQMPNSPAGGAGGGNGGPATPPTLNNNYGSLPDLTNIQLSPSPAGPQAGDFVPSAGGGGSMGGRYVNTSMPPPDSPSQLRHNPFAGSPTHKQSMPMNLSLPYSYPAAAAGSATAAVSPTGSSMGKQFINETIRKRISDKRLAQASLNHFRNSQNEACSSPVSPHTPPVCSPDGGSGSAGNSPAPHDFFPHMFYSMPQQQTLHHHQLPSPHSPLPQVQSPPVPQAVMQPGQVPPALPHQSMQHQLRQHAPQAASAHPLSFDPYKMDTQQQRHPSVGNLGGFGVMNATSGGGGGGGGGGGQYSMSASMPGCMPSIYGDVSLGYSNLNSGDMLGSGGSGGSIPGSGGMVMGHMMVGEGSLSGLRHAGAMHKRIPNIVLTGADESMRQDCFKDVGCPVFQESFDSSDLFPTDEQFRAELAPLDFEGLQMLDDPSSLVTDPNTEDQLRLG